MTYPYIPDGSLTIYSAGPNLPCCACGAQTTIHAATSTTDAGFTTYCADCWRQRSEATRRGLRALAMFIRREVRA